MGEGENETQTIGNLSYAPFANNQAFFEKYFHDILVINGVDAQTNSHTTGIIHNWSGRNSRGFPTLTSIYAAATSPELPMAYLNFGGFGNTEGIIRSTRISEFDQILNIVFPNQDPFNNELFYRKSSDWDRIQQYHQQNISDLLQENGAASRNKDNRQFYYDALLQAEGLKEFGNRVPPQDQIEQQRDVLPDYSSSLHQQIQISLTAFSAGVSVAADLYEGKFDTHSNNDEQQGPLLTNTTDAIDFLWTTAEELGIADRIILLIGSDFGRTPHYNSGNGKDHWPIGSYIVMEKNAGFTNRVFGATDEGHNALPVNAITGQPDPIQGIRLLPAHVHRAIRSHLGIIHSQPSESFPLNETEDLAIFG